MRSVKESDFSFMIWCLAWNEQNIQTCLVCRELLGYRFRSLDDPKMEDLTLYDKIVLVADALVYLVDRILRIAGNYTVNKGAIYSAGLLEPFLETVTKLPQVDVLIDAFLELLSVQKDKLAWKDDESFGLIAVEMGVTTVKKLSQLARI